MSVAIVSFNTRELLAGCLQSVAAGHPADTVVVDNGSTDGSVQMVRDRFPAVRVIANARNRGYGAAANQAIAAWTAPAGLLLNTDTVIAPDTLMRLGAYLASRPKVAVAGPRLVGADGRLQRSTYPFPGPLDTLMAEGGLHVLVRRVPGLRELALRTWRHDRPRPVAWVLGAALAIRRSAFDAVGGFDPAYFMYGEELDLSRRLAARGFATHFAPVTTVVHLGGASTAAVSAQMRREFVISHARTLRTTAGARSGPVALALLRTIIAARYLRERLRASRAPSAEDRARSRRHAGELAGLLRERSLWKL